MLVPDAPQLPLTQVAAPAPSLKESRSKQRSRTETLQAIEGAQQQEGSQATKKRREPPRDFHKSMSDTEVKVMAADPTYARGRWVDIFA